MTLPGRAEEKEWKKGSRMIKVSPCHSAASLFVLPEKVAGGPLFSTLQASLSDTHANAGR